VYGEAAARTCTVQANDAATFVASVPRPGYQKQHEVIGREQRQFPRLGRERATPADNLEAHDTSNQCVRVADHCKGVRGDR
jgi:hypothetical protein